MYFLDLRKDSEKPILLPLSLQLCSIHDLACRSYFFVFASPMFRGEYENCQNL